MRLDDCTILVQSPISWLTDFHNSVLWNDTLLIERENHEDSKECILTGIKRLLAKKSDW
jgi:hypothetical protein